MIEKIKIGSHPDFDVVIKQKNVEAHHATIFYGKGDYYIQASANSPISLNGKIITTSHLLKSSDKFQIGNKTLFWSDYYQEGGQQIRLSTIFNYHGRINKSNYRAVSLLFIGIAICIFFMPGIIVAVISSRRRLVDFDTIEAIQNISIPVFFFAYGGLLAQIILTSIKRMRDIGKSNWNLLIPFYNLKLLFFDESKIW